MVFGARVWKTGIAVTLALYISAFLNFTPPVIAAVAAIFAMQPSIYRSWRYFLEQLQTNVLGAVLALLAGMFFSNNVIAIGIVCILVIIICLRMGMEQTIGLTLVTVVAVMEASAEWQFAVNRFLLSLIGIGCAFLINILFFPPKPKEQLGMQIHSVFSRMSLLLRTVISDEMKETVFRVEKKALQTALQTLSEKYKLMEEEVRKVRKAGFSRIRHLVIYKQMLHALYKGMQVLDAVEEHYFQATRSSQTDDYFDQHLERLIKFHEHVLLKFEDKLKADSSDGLGIEAENERFMTTLIDRYNEKPSGMLRLSVVAAAMFDYGHQVARLDKLVDHYHRGEEKEPLDALMKKLGWK
ncbi:aromatic acid exporter family protein [Paenibacillus doosanensis]|uniref:Fusaric acid resistance protein family protein n=1 Tax=Paenibacillus konkukensis TaxID=2020716 RepID=A0ABY4REF6_9BACL|nr:MULTISPECIES: aromatic acid exporter family protein [Paenibacillus]MCS7461556.1 aromatic acid exporter family protein [Paenibacillus doosanensis]UQZ80952.1 Fusaric acid resistance protein family protein [Paenibacillus konkukensis]